MTAAIVIAALGLALIAIAAGTRHASRRHRQLADTLTPGKHRAR